MAGQRSLYDVLGLTITASSDDVRARADALLIELRELRTAPAVGVGEANNEQQFVAYARETLCDPLRRAKYDRQLRDNAVAAVQPSAALSGAHSSRQVDGGDVVSSRAPWLLLGAAVVAIAAVGGYLFAQKRAAPIPLSALPTLSATPALAAVPTVAKSEPLRGLALPVAPNIAPASTGDTDLSAADIFKMNQASVVVVKGPTSADGGSVQGSGVVIGAEAVVTNCHVARAGTEVSVRVGNQSLPAKMRFSDQGHDLCQLTVRGLTAPAVKRVSVATLAVGSKVYAIGAPQGLDLSLSDGVVASLRSLRSQQGESIIQTTAAISPGSSGGGLFDAKGQLVGITTFQMRGGQNLNFAVPSDWIDQLAKRDGNTDSLLPENAQSPIPRSAVAGGPASAETENRRRLLLGKWDCHTGAAIATRQIQYEFAADNTLAIRTKKTSGGADWNAVVGRYRLVNESILILDDSEGRAQQTVLKLTNISSTSAVFEWQAGERLVHYCSH